MARNSIRTRNFRIERTRVTDPSVRPGEFDLRIITVCGSPTRRGERHVDGELGDFIWSVLKSNDTAFADRLLEHLYEVEPPLVTRQMSQAEWKREKALEAKWAAERAAKKAA